jgi:solute:Na+ symporter, SSS family
VWFLIGGDLYTAYTVIAVPATMYAGSAVGFFAVPYTIVVYPLIFLFLPRLWSVSHRHAYVTPADFVQGRYGSKSLGLAVALTGILATMPYIALQLVGIQVVLQVAGFGGSNGFVKDLPLIIAFVVLAAYTYSSGLRAPAVIAFVKDTLIYIVIIVAVIYLPHKIGGWDHVFSTVKSSFDSFNSDNADAIASKQASGKALFTPPVAQWAYASLALGSALALFMYPHSITGVLSTKNRGVIRRNAALLPAYSFLLGLIALLGFVAVAAGVKVDNPQQSVPQLFENEFPSWFAGVGFAAIAIGALVPAAIMSIAAANLFTRNIYRAYFRPGATPAEEATVGKLVSLVVKLGALIFVLALSKSFAINLQLLGGVWILPDLPGDRGRALHPVVPQMGGAARLGGRHGLRHLGRLRHQVPDPESLRQPAREVPVHRHLGLHRRHGVRPQRAGGDRPHLRLPCAERGRRGR